MANYQLLKADIDAKVYQNGAQEITGANLNAVLNAMVTTLGAEYQFAGVATTATNPGTPDAKVFYIANGKGTYTNFGGLEVTEDDVVVLYWDSSWHKVSTGIASQEKLTELESKVAILGSEAVDGQTSVYLDITSLPKKTYKIKVDFGGETFANFKIWQQRGYNSGNIISMDVTDGEWADITIDAEANFLLFFSAEAHTYTLSYELVEESSQVYRNQINIADLNSKVSDHELKLGKTYQFNVAEGNQTDHVISVVGWPKGKYRIKPQMSGVTPPININIYRTKGLRSELIKPLYTNCYSGKWIEIDITEETNYLWLWNSAITYSYVLDIMLMPSESWGSYEGGEYAKNGMFAYSVKGNQIWVSKASGTQQIAVGIDINAEGQGNGLPDIRSIGTLPLGLIPSSDNVNVLHYSSSDWIAPFKIRAVNNADGDDLTGNTFTGGSHQYNNAITGGTPTAKLLYMKVYVDGVLTESGQGYASRLKIDWVSQIQGTNTKKGDGSGRYILEEYVTLEYDGNTWQCTTRLNPLESLYLDLWYGYQFTGISDAGIFSQWSFIGAKNRANNSNISGDNDCIGVRAIGDKVSLEMWLNDRVDMGKRQFCSEGLDRSAFKSGAKAYFTIANNKSVLQSYSPYILKGEYKIMLK